METAHHALRVWRESPSMDVELMQTRQMFLKLGQHLHQQLHLHSAIDITDDDERKIERRELRVWVLTEDMMAALVKALTGESV